MSLYEKRVFKEFKEVKNSSGKRQFNLKLGGEPFMMLPTDMALNWDPKFRDIVK